MILVLISAAYSIISVNSVRKIGAYAIDIDNKNVQDISTELFTELTLRITREYSHYFEDAETITKMLATEIGEELLNKEKIEGLNNKLNEIKLENYKEKNFYKSRAGSGASVLYWGKNEDGKVPKKVTEQINSLNILTPLLNALLRKHNKHNYFNCIWIHSKDSFQFMVPESKVYYKTITSREGFESYFKGFNLLEKHKNSFRGSKAHWIKPYKDITGDTVLSVFTPAYDTKGDLMAMVGLDINLKKFVSAMISCDLTIERNLKASNESAKEKQSLINGFLFLMDKDSDIIAFPGEYADFFSLPLGYSNLKYFTQEISTKMLDSKDPSIRKTVRRILKKKSGIEMVNIKGTQCLISYNRLESTGWILCFTVDEKSLMAPALKTRQEVSRVELVAIKRGMLFAFVLLIISILITIAFFRRALFSRVDTMKKKIRRMAKGEYHIKFREEGIAEIAELASTFNYLGSELETYTATLKKEIRARQQIEAEVRIAADIQKSMLPIVTNKFKGEDFQIAAKWSSAKEASGDYYDFFYIDENRVALIIADVSGKGIPAAFFMGTVKTLLKSVCLQENDDPAKALNKVNVLLSQDNSTLMFVTLIVCYYDIITGKLVFANAGHHDAICLGCDGLYRRFGRMKGIALGVTDTKYRSNKTFINKNDKVVLYTDGVIEAVSPDNEDYGEDRFKKFLLRNVDLNCEDLAKSIIREVRNFEKQKRYDDVTVLVLERKI
ncbi:MAG: SpoIIE family protein phosphatase [Victivallales bacterium]|nr:SpoIIE family protein phosphatase [Victivallales bacterium]